MSISLRFNTAASKRQTAPRSNPKKVFAAQSKSSSTAPQSPAFLDSSKVINILRNS